MQSESYTHGGGVRLKQGRVSVIKSINIHPLIIFYLKGRWRISEEMDFNYYSFFSPHFMLVFLEGFLGV